MADRARPDQNNRHTLIASSSAGDGTVVELIADPLTRALVVSGGGGSGGGGGTQYTQGGAAVANPTGNGLIYFNGSNVPTAVTSATPLPVSASVAPAPSIISTANSRTATLTAGSTFIGTAEDITNYSSVTVAVTSDVASATDGLSIQQSPDGTNWDITDVYTIPAATGKTFGVQVSARYFRIVYTNGAANQGSFRLQTIFHINAPNSSSQRPSDGRSNDNDMQEAIGYGAVYDPATNTWNRARQIATGIQGVGLSDGSTVTSVLPGDAGRNGLVSAYASKTIPFTTTGTGAQIVGPFNVDGYAKIAIQFNASTLGTGVAFQAQFSTDGGVSWNNSVEFQNSTGTSGITQVPTATANLFVGPTLGPLFRFQFTTLTTGPSAGTIWVSSAPYTATTMGVSATLANIATQTYSSDLQSTSTTGINTQSYMLAHGGTFAERVKTAGQASNTAGTGLLGSGTLVKSAIANPTGLTTGNWQPALADVVGKQVVVQSLRPLKGDTYTILTSTTTETTIIAATTGQYNDLFAIVATNTSATAVEVVFRDVAAGSVRFSIFIPANDTRGFMLSESAAYKQTTLNTAWTAQCQTSVASVKITASYVGNI